ncbi:glycosyltransferase family 22 protein [Chaetomium fimeti]|uniref:Mannosyltransferase n=1 Tax=Chaetomium fimeti TaxID=1854472 RepID=A0AAE0HQH7_9PEZI|nr:glycosyltransferase family 22 protein [Chaetomium fimeti]
MSPSKNEQSTSAKNHKIEALATRLLDPLLYLSIPLLILVHLIVAPYTKVEESFNIQAAHDVLVYGAPTSDIYNRLSSSYDHFTFPGAVPRTFVGPVLLAGFAQPIVALVGFQHAQLVVRAILGLFNAACLHVFARNVRRAYGPGVGRWYIVLQASQFHVLFYASRTLPNMFAFGLTTLAFSFLLPAPLDPKSTARRQRLSITTFVFAAVIFRSEVALLLFTTVLYQLLQPSLSLNRVIRPFIISFLAALAISVPIDTYFWQHPRPLWPELSGFIYNVLHGGASAWGTLPWHWYFTNAIPRLLLSPLTCQVRLPYSLTHPVIGRGARALTIPSLLFIALYSLQPHKETRFIIYVAPPLTAAAALNAHRAFRRAAFRRGGANTFFRALLAVGILLSVAGSYAASSIVLVESALNYPGGDALAYVRGVAAAAAVSGAGAGAGAGGGAGVVQVHADVLACMTGVTLFGTDAAAARVASSSSASSAPGPGVGGDDNGGEIVMVKQQQQRGGYPAQNGVRIVVDKTEDDAVLASADFWTRFDYLLMEDRSKVVGGEWDTVGVVKGFSGLEVVKPGSEQEDKVEKGAPPVVGLGETVARWKRTVRGLTGGWWYGPRMVEKIYIMRRVKEAPSVQAAVEAK